VTDFVTIPNVELASVGMKWPSAAGIVTLTFEHLADAVAASQDVHIRPPRLKLGHSDERFNAERQIDHDPFYTGDAEPAVGVVGNLRVVDNGCVLMGDYEEVPLWLADALPSAYPSRSIEGAYTIEMRGGEPIGTWNVTTQGGRTYSFVLTACALLGTVPPAIADIEDLRRFLVEGRGAVVAGRDPSTGGVAASGNVGGMPNGPVTAEADVDKVIVAFCEDFCTGDRYYWWPRSFRVDPNRIIADDEEGGLWAVTATTDEEQNVSFGEPESVLQLYVPAEARGPMLASAAVSSDLLTGTVAARFASRADLPDTVPAHVREGGSPDSGTTSGMNFTAEQRTALIAKHGLADTATDDQIVAAVMAAPSDPPAGGDGGENGPAGGDGAANGGDGTQVPAGDDDSGKGDDDSGSGAGGEGGGAEASTTMTVDRGAWEESQQALARLSASDEKRRGEIRATELEAHIKRGAITPGTKDDWAAKFSRDEDTTRKELEGLPDNLIPVNLRGHGGGPNGGAEATAAHAPTRDEMVGLFGAAYAPPAQEA
jgi:hypothetical protein